MLMHHGGRLWWAVHAAYPVLYHEALLRHLFQNHW